MPTILKKSSFISNMGSAYRLLRYQAEVRLKGMPKALTAVFDRKNDAKAWISKTEADIRCGRHQLYSEGKRHTFSEAVERYFKEQTVSVVKSGHLLWWKKELGSLFLLPFCHIRFSVYPGYDILIFISDLLNLDMKSLEQLEQQFGGDAYFSSTFTDINKALPTMLYRRYSMQ